MSLTRLLTVLLCMLLMGDALAAACDTVFSNAVGTRGSRLELRNNAKLLNTGSAVLASGDLRSSGIVDHCDNQPCIESGSGLSALPIPSHGTNTDLNNQNLSLTPGDHYFDNVTFSGSNTLTLSGSGQVRVHVRRDLRISDNARINVNGDPLDLVFLVGDDVRIEDNSQVKAIIYAKDRLEVRNSAVVEGAGVGDRADIRDDASITFKPTSTLDISGVCSTGSGGPIIIGPLNFKIEVGALTIVDTYAKPDFTRVNFTQQFNTPPLVFTLPTNDGGNSAAHRIRNVTSDGFDIMTLEPEGEDGPHIAMSLNYLAVERGVHDLPGGRKLIADTVDTRRVQAYANAGGGIGWETVGFGGIFSQAPVVLAQIQTMVNEQETRIPSKPSKPWLTTAITDVRATDMKIALERSESLTGNVNRNETVAFFALEPVSRISFTDSNNQTVDMEAIRTSELLQGWGTCGANRVNFSKTWSRTPVVLATKNTRDGDAGAGDGDGGWLRRCSTSTSYTELQVDEVRKNNIGDRNRTHSVRERAGVVAFSGNFVMAARQLDHFRMIHDGLGVAGVPESVTIKACTNSDCSRLYTGSVTVSLQPADSNTSWSGSGVLANQVTFTGGTQIVSLDRSSAGTFNIGLTATPVPQKATRCFVGTTETCSITFAATAFVVTLPDQVSGGTSAGSVSVPTCWSDFQSKTLKVDVGLQYVSPILLRPAAMANGVLLPTDGSTAVVDLVFDASCVAPIQLSYADAGELGLNVGFVGSGGLSGLTMSGSDNLVFYPAAFSVQAMNSSAVPLNAAAPGTLPVHGAGEGFTLTVKAVNSAGVVTQGYKPQALDRIRAYVERTGPTTGGVNGTFSLSATGDVLTRLNPPTGPGDYSVGNVGPGDFKDGEYINLGAAYSEVGLVTLYLTDYDYMGHTIGATPLQIGRFIPHEFQVSPAYPGSVYILNRAATVGCAGGSFTYLGEGLSLGMQLIAKNAAGGITRNYQGLFARFGLSPVGFSAYAGAAGKTLAARHPGSNLSNRLSVNSETLSVWSAGFATLNIDLTLQSIATADGPYDGTSLGLSFADSDGAALDGLNMDVDGDGSDDHLDLGSTDFRMGRLTVGNAHGSELRDLDVPVAMQYFGGAGQGFSTHTLDSCTPVTAVALSDADPGDSLQVSDTCIVDQLGASGADACAAGTPGRQYSGTASAGEYVVSLTSPGAGKTGGLRVTAVPPHWARFDWASSGKSDPVGIATFGIYNRNTEVIYQREIR